MCSTPWSCRSIIHGGAAESSLRELATKHNENDAAHGVVDKWELEDKEWAVCVHQRPRREMFTPLRVSGGPSVKGLLHARVTIGQYVDNGESFRFVDSWASRGSAHRLLPSPWVGTTSLMRKCDEVNNKDENVMMC